MSAHGLDPTSETIHLVREAKSGSSAALASLYQRSAPMLLAWAEARIRPSLRPAVDGDDLLQESWYRAVDAFPRYDPARQTFRPWLLGIARNVLLESLRRIARARTCAASSEDASTDALDANAEPMTTIRTRLAADEVLAEFRAYVAELDETEREILLQCGFEERAPADVALDLGVSADAVEKRWQRLRTRLRSSRFARRFEL